MQIAFKRHAVILGFMLLSFGLLGAGFRLPLKARKSDICTFPLRPTAVLAADSIRSKGARGFRG